MRGSSWCTGWWVGLLASWMLGGSAVAQLEDLRITIEQGYAGLDGYMVPGQWAPIRLSVDNLSADDRDVVFRWQVEDEDGDRVLAQRRATLTRQRDDQPVWLYAPIPRNTRDTTRWTLRALAAGSGQQLANLTFEPQESFLLRQGQTLIGVTSASDLGLNDAGQHVTSHAPIRLVRGLSLGRLPDRWQGLEALHALVWTGDLGDDPTDPLRVPEASLAALRGWVYRGGHLVVVLPEVGQTWTQSALADMLPVSDRQLRPVETESWWEIEGMGGMLQINSSEVGGRSSVAGQAVSGGDGAAGAGEGGGNRAMTVTTFDGGGGGARGTGLLRGAEERPVVVAGRYGFGGVTLIGVDLTSRVFRSNGGMVGDRRVWHRVFGWNFPLLSPDKVNLELRGDRLLTAERVAGQNRVVPLGRFVPGQIAMTGTVAALLVGAVVWFGVYWLTAGWLLQPLLRRRGREQWSWVGFVAMVGLFAAVAWAGAALLRPAETEVRHLTVLDYDGNTRTARGRAFASLFVPRFGTAELRVGEARLPEDVEEQPRDDGDGGGGGGGGGASGGVDSGDLLSSPGFSVLEEDRGFLDPQAYLLDAASPDATRLPVRSTSKALQLDYLGRVDGDLPGLAEPFAISATVPLELGEDGWPRGEVTHTLPGELSNVQVVFCPGESVDARGRRRPLPAQVWRYVDENGDNRWGPGRPLRLAGRPADPLPLTPPLRSWSAVPDERDWKNEEGLLGRRFEETQVGSEPSSYRVDESVIVRHLELLTFFDAVPVADLKRDPDRKVLENAKLLQRTLGSGLDMTPLLRGRRVVILGHLPDGPLPIPLSVEGQTPPSRGWTFVRWVYDF